ncbi:alpha/beta fold hydrolase [Rhodohalobacter sp. 614A]|uniref:alpha/beta fold hydrolase n=1 Tax=Rhodohalobacter sp. 614A TaxID=2908649 RepID=UPI001F266814|nr:alpha/beta hydrolase [Rhodohalobacter sp. 614A]
MKNKIFRSESAKEKLEEWYQTFHKKIDAPTESIHVETSFGSNHVLKAGDESKPVLVCLHSMLTSSAHLVSEIQRLLKHYYIIAPDLPGQSVRGLETRFSYSDNSFADWLLEIIDNLGLEKINLLGVSLGGFAALQFAKNHPEKVQHLVLIVPAGIVRGSTWEGIRKMAIPSMLYQFNQTEERLKKFVDPLLSTWDDDWGHYIGDSFTLFKPDFRIPPLISDEELKEWDIPTYVFAAEEDISFPGKPMVQKLKINNPDIQTYLMKDCKHSPPTTPEFRKWLSKKILSFLEMRQEDG